MKWLKIIQMECVSQDHGQYATCCEFYMRASGFIIKFYCVFFLDEMIWKCSLELSQLSRHLKIQFTGIWTSLQKCTSGWSWKGDVLGKHKIPHPSLILLFHAGFLPVVLVCHFTLSVLIGSLRRSSSYNQLTQLLFSTNIWIWNRHANVFLLNSTAH